MGWRDFTPDFIEDAGEDLVEGAGDLVEWAGDKTADLADKAGWDSGADWIRDKSRSLANVMGADVAEMELDETEDPKKIIYGSVSKLRANAQHLGDLRTNFDKVGKGIKGLDSSAIKGQAAEAFGESVAQEPPKWFKAADAFEKAQNALTRFAETVEWAQGRAEEAIADYKAAKKASEDARTAYNAKVDEYNAAVKAEKDELPPRPSGFTDPGEAGVKAAYDKVVEARQQRNEAAERAHAAITAARDAAPPKPSYAEQVGDGIQGLQIDAAHLTGGVIKGTAGLVNFVRSVNPTDPYNLTHPAEYVMSLNSTAAGLVTAVNDPVGTAKNMVDAFMKDPAEGVGKLIPELVGSKGLGALKKAATVAKHADDFKLPGRTHLDKDGPGATSRTPKDKVCVDDPVDVATGRMVLPQTDLVLPGALPLVLARTFESSFRAGRWFGPSWSSTLDQRLEIDTEGVVLVGEDGSLLAYPHPAPGLPVLPTHGRRWPLARTPEDDYTVTDPESGRVWHFTPEGLLVQLEDRNGAWIAYDHDPDGTPTAVRHSGGYEVRITTGEGRVTALSLADGTRVLDYAYAEGQLTEVVNSSGRPLRFGYDDRSRIVSWTDTNGRHFDYAYDDRDRCVAQSGTHGHVNSRFRYEPGTTTVTGALGHQRVYHIDDQARVVAETDAGGATTRYERDRYNHLLSRTDPLGRTTRVTYEEHGWVTSVTRPDGRATTIDYNELGLPVRVTRPDGTTVRQRYDERGNRTSVTGPSGTTTRYTYDDRGHLASTTGHDGTTTRVRCDAAGRVVESTDAHGGVTRYTHDAFGRPVTVTDPLDRVTRLTWSVEGRLLHRVEPDGSEQSWTYDGEGNLLTHTDPAGGRSAYEYGDFDRLAARTGPDGARYEFTHDTELRLTGVTDPRGLTWSYAYDPAGRLTSETDFDGRTLRYAYDEAGQLTARTNALGEVVRYAYNDLGQIVLKDAAGAVTRYEYDFFDELARATGPDATLSRVRDRAGLLRSETVNGGTLGFAYDELGRPARRTTPTGAVSEWSHDAAGNRTRLTTSGRTLTFEHDATGRELTRTVGTSVTLSHRFDAQGRLADQHLIGHDGRTLQRRSYAYRADSHLTAVDDALNGPRAYTLDAAARVTAVDARDWAERYAYDAAGNQTDASWTAGRPDQKTAAGPRTYDGNHLTDAGGLRYEHDAQGRVVLRQKTRLSRKPDTWRYTWDAEDRLVGVVTPDGTRWSYLYDPLGRRIAKRRHAPDGEVLEETTFTWEGATLCEQTTTSAETADRLVTLTWDHQGLHPLAQTERILTASHEEIADRFFSIVTDLVGAPTELVTEQGEIAWRARSTVWGTTFWNRDASTYTPLRFPGQYFDPETGLHHNVFRTYDPETARYLSPDPLGLAPAPNPATYVHNPLTWSDHLGLAPDECTVTVYRKQTEHPLSQRVHVDENGNVTISGNNQLYVNMSGDIRHTIEFRGDNGQIVSFEVPKSFVDDIRRNAVPQDQPDGLGFTKQEWKQVKKFYPEISDPTRGTDLYGLPGEVIDKMRKVIIPGSGKIVQDFD
ncbi:putative T7SS-secreted protein [Streptomyces sp. NPDC004284]|uniref:putative T7SS-secreted protein n=1 Tax=Streptomyces sp. NPDC004284 TaxID=3364695 RepID=UPI003681F1C6